MNNLTEKIIKNIKELDGLLHECNSGKISIDQINDAIDNELTEKQLVAIRNRAKKQLSSMDDKSISQHLRSFLNKLVLKFDKNIVDNLSPADKKNWLSTVDKLIRLDKYSMEDIELAVTLARNDPFWNKNFQSIVKLRKKNSEGIKYIAYFLTFANSNINTPAVKEYANGITEATKEDVLAVLGDEALYNYNIKNGVEYAMHEGVACKVHKQGDLKFIVVKGERISL